MISLAAKYQVSDVAIKKRCRVRGVPTPPRGYWAKLEAGKKVKRPSLPNEVPVKPKQVSKPEDVVYISTGKRYSVRNPHWVTVATRESIAKDLRGQYNMICWHSKESMLVEVSKRSIGRILWMVESLTRQMEDLGATMTYNYPGRWGLGAVALGQFAQIIIKEKVRQFDNPDSKSWYGDRKVNIPSGILKVQANFTGWIRGRQWIETVHTPLEDRLEGIAVEIMGCLVSARVRVDSKERKDAFAAYEEELSRKHALELRVEDDRRRRLVEAANSMAESLRIRSLVREVLCSTDGRELDALSRERLAGWTVWATEHADRLDPVRRILADLGISGVIQVNH